MQAAVAAAAAGSGGVPHAAPAVCCFAMAECLAQHSARVPSLSPHISFPLADEQKWTTLMWAAASGHAGLVRLLIARGSHIEARGSGAQCTALMLAAANSHCDVVEALIERGAQLNAQDLAGASALLLAAQRGHTAIVQQLLRAGADAALRSYSGETALAAAAAGGHTAVVRVLLGASSARKDGTATKLLEGLSHEQLLMLVHQLAAALQVGGGRCCLVWWSGCSRCQVEHSGGDALSSSKEGCLGVQQAVAAQLPRCYRQLAVCQPLWTCPRRWNSACSSSRRRLSPLAARSNGTLAARTHTTLPTAYSNFCWRMPCTALLNAHSHSPRSGPLHCTYQWFPSHWHA